jgi:hypothetical protein
VYNDRGCGWTGEFCILGEYQVSILLDKRPIGDELLALGYNVGPCLYRKMACAL